MLINNHIWFKGTPSRHQYRVLTGKLPFIWFWPCINAASFAVGLTILICANMLNPNSQPWHWYLHIMVYIGTLPTVVGGILSLMMIEYISETPNYAKKRRKSIKERVDRKQRQMFWSGEAVDLNNINGAYLNEPYAKALAALVRQPAFDLDLCARYESDVESFINDPDALWYIDLLSRLSRSPEPAIGERRNLEHCLNDKAKAAVDNMIALDESRRNTKLEEQKAIAIREAAARQEAADKAEHAHQALIEEIHNATDGYRAKTGW